MRFAGLADLTGAVALGLCTAIVLAPLALAAPKGDKPDALPSLKTLSEPRKSLREAHREILNSLYDQLQKTDSEEGAELIVSAIEKLWSRSGSDTADILMERAGFAMNARNYTLAARILTALTEVEPRYAAGWNQLATVYFLEDRYFEAMQNLRHVLAIDSRHFKAIEGLGIILRETGNKKAALAVTRRALAINPHMKSAKQAEQELSREVEGQGI
jgi:tetratricopeptide (TPR) repeat protein